MSKLKERYLVDEHGNQVGVLLEIAEYRRILEELEELASKNWSPLRPTIKPKLPRMKLSLLNRRSRKLNRAVREIRSLHSQADARRIRYGKRYLSCKSSNGRRYQCSILVVLSTSLPISGYC
jgi:hypothetical protein